METLSPHQPPESKSASTRVIIALWSRWHSDCVAFYFSRSAMRPASTAAAFGAGTGPRSRRARLHRYRRRGSSGGKPRGKFSASGSNHHFGRHHQRRKPFAGERGTHHRIFGRAESNSAKRDAHFIRASRAAHFSGRSSRIRDFVRAYFVFVEHAPAGCQSERAAIRASEIVSRLVVN